jgi:hypothetical protein
MGFPFSFYYFRLSRVPTKKDKGHPDLQSMTPLFITAIITGNKGNLKKKFKKRTAAVSGSAGMPEPFSPILIQKIRG